MGIRAVALGLCVPIAFVLADASGCDCSTTFRVVLSLNIAQLRSTAKLENLDSRTSGASIKLGVSYAS